MRKLKFNDEIIEVCDEHAPVFMKKWCKPIACTCCELNDLKHDMPCNEVPFDFWNFIKSVTDVTEENKMKFKIGDSLREVLRSVKFIVKNIDEESNTYTDGDRWVHENGLELDTSLKIILKKDYKKGAEIEILNGKIVEKPVWTLPKILACEDIEFGCSLKIEGICTEHIVLGKEQDRVHSIIEYNRSQETFRDTYDFSTFNFFTRSGDEIFPPEEK